MDIKQGNILVIDDNEDIHTSLRLLLKKYVESVETVKDPRHIPRLLKTGNYDVILLDMNFSRDVISGQEGFYWLDRILETDPAAVVIFITAYGDVEKSVKAIKAGATDFVLKPWQNEKLVATVSSSVKLRRSRLEADTYRRRQEELGAVLDRPFHDFIGTSSGMKQVFATIRKVAGTDANVLILGENGTGKELVARALHRHSARSAGIFLCVDLGAITATLFESELFGHVRGAFTDAKKERTGRFELASGGTLFLDEIGNLSLPLQAKLLNAIEKREVTRVGADRSTPVDVRLICATNVPLDQLENEENFRQDLLYRIKTVEIHIPPLRERQEDIPLLARHFLKSLAGKYHKRINGINREAMEKLKAYPWPGNVRELQHAVERAVILNESEVLATDDFILSSARSKDADGDGPASLNMEDVEKQTIQTVLDRHRGNVSRASKELGISRGALYRRLDKYDI